MLPSRDPRASLTSGPHGFILSFHCCFLSFPLPPSFSLVILLSTFLLLIPVLRSIYGLYRLIHGATEAVLSGPALSNTVCSCCYLLKPRGADGGGREHLFLLRLTSIQQIRLIGRARHPFPGRRFHNSWHSQIHYKKFRRSSLTMPWHTPPYDSSSSKPAKRQRLERAESPFDLFVAPYTPRMTEAPVQVHDETDAKIELVQEQQEALNTILEGKNVFLTGEAGSGKTVVLKKAIVELREQGRHVRVTAPTGKAACEGS